MLANLQNYLEIKHDCLLIYVNRVISQGGDQGDRSLIFFSKKFVNSHNKLYLCSVFV
jgi:hypothetical protein